MEISTKCRNEQSKLHGKSDENSMGHEIIEIQWFFYMFMDCWSNCGRNVDGNSRGISICSWIVGRISVEFSMEMSKGANGISTKCPWNFYDSVGASEITLTVRSSWFPQLCVFHQDQTASKTFTRPLVTFGLKLFVELKAGGAVRLVVGVTSERLKEKQNPLTHRDTNRLDNHQGT